MDATVSVFFKNLFWTDTAHFWDNLKIETFGMSSIVSKLTYFMFNIIKQLATFHGCTLNIVHWCILSTFVWSIVYEVYTRSMKLLLHRVGVTKINSSALLKTMWQLSFTLVSIPAILFCLGGGLSDTFTLSGNWVTRLDYQGSRCKIHEDIFIAGVTTVFVLHCSFSTHDLIITCYSKGFKNSEFVQKQLFLAVFVLTYYSKCPLLGFTALFLLHCASLAELLSKFCLIIGNFTKSTALNYLARICCGYHILAWMKNYFYYLPTFLLNSKTMDSTMMKAEVKMLIILDFLIWLYILTALFSSVLTRIVMSYALPSKRRPKDFEYILFGNDALVRRNLNSNLKRLTVDDLVETSEDSRQQRNKAILIQTIQCSILLKRKIKRMREAKAKKLAEQRNTFQEQQ